MTIADDVRGARTARRQALGLKVHDRDRILELPVAPAAPDLTEELRVPGGTWTLRPAQSAALWAMKQYGGGIFSIATGLGKTAVGQLAPTYLDIPAEKVLVLTTAQLVREAEREFLKYEEHFKVQMPVYVSYSMLSSQKGVGMLEDLAPAWIIADECHALKNKKAARTGRFLAFLRRNPHVKFAGMSGTLTTRSLHDFGHLADKALGAGSPVPRAWTRLSMWAKVIDAAPQEEASRADHAEVEPLRRWAGTKDARVAFFKRFSTAPGCVLTTQSSCKQPITMTPFARPITPEVKAVMKDVKRAGVMPDGELLPDKLRVAAKVRELGQGFYYRWEWPGGEPDIEWLVARRDYAAAVASYIKGRSKLDTEGLVRKALARGETLSEDLSYAWPAWNAVRHRPLPPVETVWLDKALIEWAASGVKAGILWYQHRAVGEALREAGVPTAMAGEDVPDAPLVALSISSHGTGLNLQCFRENVVLCPPSSGGTWEQMIARTHRAGQEDPVLVRWNASTAEYKGAMRQALRDAEYIEKTTGGRQKLNTAEKTP